MESLRQPGAQLRVYGETGVGKTSLVAFATTESGRRALTVACRTSHDFADIIEQAISSIQGVRLTSYKKHRVANGAVEAGAKVAFFTSIKGKVSGETGKERTFEVVQKSPVDLLVDLMVEKGYGLLVLDNFQNVVDPETRTEVGQLMEVLSDRSGDTGDLKVVVVGIAEDARTLLTPSPSVRRRTIDIGVPGMPDFEIKAIFENGFRLLGLTIGEHLLDHLVYYSDGFPYFAHALGLNVARNARVARSRSIEAVQFAGGLLRTLNEVDETYADRTRRAYAQSGPVKSKRKLLELMARSTKRDWTVGELKSLWAHETRGLQSDLKSVGTVMSSLVTEECGAVLIKDESSTPHRYRFSDPYFRTYIRLASELGASSAERETLLTDRDDEEQSENY